METEERAELRTRSALREVLETLLFTLLIYFLVRTFLFENYRVVGNSMQPTLHSDQFLVVDKLDYRLHPPQRGDVVVFRDPNAPDRKLIKRVIGLPGEVLEVRDGVVLVNDRVIDEPYLDDEWHHTRAASPIPPEHYFVMGDNRNNSSDSRSWGTLPAQEIIGKAWISYWPPDAWGLIPHEIYGAGR